MREKWGHRTDYGGKLLVLLHFPLPAMHLNQLLWKSLQSGAWPDGIPQCPVLSHPLPPTSILEEPSTSESSLKHFENPSYPELFHLFPLILTLQSRATRALCLGESRSFMHLHEQGLRCLILGSEYCSLMLLEWLSTYINSEITHLATI